MGDKVWKLLQNYILNYTHVLWLSVSPPPYSLVLYSASHHLSLQQRVQYLPGEGDSHDVRWHQQAMGASGIWQSVFQQGPDLSQPRYQHLQSGGPQNAGRPAGTRQACTDTGRHTSPSCDLAVHTYSTVSLGEGHTHPTAWIFNLPVAKFSVPFQQPSSLRNSKVFFYIFMPGGDQLSHYQRDEV